MARRWRQWRWRQWRRRLRLRLRRGERGCCILDIFAPPLEAASRVAVKLLTLNDVTIIGQPFSPTDFYVLPVYQHVTRHGLLCPAAASQPLPGLFQDTAGSLLVLCRSTAGPPQSTDRVTLFPPAPRGARQLDDLQRITKIKYPIFADTKSTTTSPPPLYRAPPKAKGTRPRGFPSKE